MLLEAKSSIQGWDIVHVVGAANLTSAAFKNKLKHSLYDKYTLEKLYICRKWEHTSDKVPEAYKNLPSYSLLSLNFQYYIDIATAMDLQFIRAHKLFHHVIHRK